MEEKNNLGLSVIAVLIAAILGGIIWATIAILTEYELGVVAWAIGGITAFAVVKSTKNITPVHQIISVVASLIGIFIGKYFTFAYFVSEAFMFDGMFDSDIFPLFTENITEMLALMDIVFILLAVVTAWQAPLKFAAKREQTEPQSSQADQGNSTPIE